MILLELTEKEFAMVDLAISGLWKASSVLYEENKQETDRKNMEACNSVITKLDLTYEPQEAILITSKDFFDLMSLTKLEYHRLTADLHLSNKKVEENDFKHISLASALIMWLNGKNLLKRLVKFDYTDQSSQYEETE